MSLYYELSIFSLFFQYLHGRHVLHRDMKTQNVFLTGDEMTAKLGDLGLAKYVNLISHNFLKGLKHLSISQSFDGPVFSQSLSVSECWRSPHRKLSLFVVVHTT